VVTIPPLRDVLGITSFPASLVWPLSVVDIVAALLQQADYQTARKYWNKLKERLRKEESESVTNCHQLKRKVLKNRLKREGSQTVTDCNRLRVITEDGKMREADVAPPKTESKPTIYVCEDTNLQLAGLFKSVGLLKSGCP
jgi:ribosome-binding ATPase YchF (GTP1/OBG family)